MAHWRLQDVCIPDADQKFYGVDFFVKKNYNIKDLDKLFTVSRRWFPLWVLDWYILREFLIKYCVLMLVFIILFILSDDIPNVHISRLAHT